MYMSYSYNMNEVLDVAKQASSQIEEYLRNLKNTVDVINVEDDINYQKKDIDIVWKLIDSKGIEREVTIEVKGDRWDKTGNYFFETISNKSKNTPGCFMYTEADYIYYYFVNTRELNRIPVKKTRKWFERNKHKFKECQTSTPVGNNEFYITVGRLVRKETVQANIPEIKVKNI